MTNYALIGRLEEKLNEIQAIVTELRGSRKIITFEGKHYKKVDREAREGEVVIFHEDSKFGFFKAGKPYKVLLNDEGTLSFEDDTSDWLDVYYNGRTTKNVDVYELITSPVFTTLEGQDLEAEYAEQVKQEVQHQTFKCSAARPPIEEVGQAFFEGASKVLNPKTPNQLRAEVIEKAKQFVEKAKYKGIVNFTVGERSAIAVHQDTTCKPNRLKGAVSNCHPNDVYNEHIGKAIALGRALGLDVSEFEQAVQPNEYVVGQEVTYTNDIAGKYKNAVHQITSLKDNVIWYENNKGYSLDGGKDFGIKIFNDTNAQYGDQA